MPALRKSVLVDIDIPEPPPTLPLFRTSERRRSSVDLREDMLARWDRWRDAFKMDGEPMELGDRIAILSDRASLEVYLASESVWWTDRSAAYRELSGDIPIPDGKDAVDLARRYIDAMLSPQTDVTLAAVGDQVGAVSTGPDDKPQTARTAVSVTWRPVVAERTVFGPGAKLRLSYAGGEEPSDVVFFQRNLHEAGEVEPVHPMQALDRLSRDRRFVAVLRAGLTMRLQRLELGYYSAAPNIAQSYLIPVYLAEGQIEGSELDADVFRLYVPAVDIDDATMKDHGIRATPLVANTFTSL